MLSFFIPFHILYRLQAYGGSYLPCITCHACRGWYMDEPRYVLQRCSLIRRKSVPSSFGESYKIATLMLFCSMSIRRFVHAPPTYHILMSVHVIYVHNMYFDVDINSYWKKFQLVGIVSKIVPIEIQIWKRGVASGNLPMDIEENSIYVGIYKRDCTNVGKPKPLFYVM